MVDKISFSDWKKLDIRTARIESVEDVPGKDKLLKLSIDLGSEKRTVVAGIKQFYSTEDLVGKSIIFLANLEPKKIAGIESNGMILAAGGRLEGHAFSLLATDKKMPIGVSVE